MNQDVCCTLLKSTVSCAWQAIESPGQAYVRAPFRPFEQEEKNYPISSRIISLCGNSRKPNWGHLTESQCLFEYTKRSPVMVLTNSRMFPRLHRWMPPKNTKSMKGWWKAHLTHIGPNTSEYNQIIQGTEGGLPDSPAVRTLEPVGAMSLPSGPTQPVCSAQLCHNLVHSSLSCQFEDSHEHVCKNNMSRVNDEGWLEHPHSKNGGDAGDPIL